jgi:hypothetical protein
MLIVESKVLEKAFFYSGKGDFSTIYWLLQNTNLKCAAPSRWSQTGGLYVRLIWGNGLRADASVLGVALEGK